MMICSHHFTGLHNQGISILLNCFWKDVPIQMLLPNGRTHHLILLLEKGHAEVARLLLDSGADATLANDDMSHHFTALHNQGISILLNCFWKDVPIQMLLTNGRTHHFILLFKGHVEIARLLLDSGADATLADDEMFTPLHCAAQSGHLDLVKLLLETGADRNAVTKGRHTPHDLAAANGHTEVARLLLGGSDVRNYFSSMYKAVRRRLYRHP
jgi:hypothetical protein